jgi:hypothetical protein
MLADLHCHMRWLSHLSGTHAASEAGCILACKRAVLLLHELLRYCYCCWPLLTPSLLQRCRDYVQPVHAIAEA